MGEDKASNEKEFKIVSTKATQEAYLKYKESENNKLIQILHITVLIIIALLSQVRENIIAGLFLIFAMIAVFSAYFHFYCYDFHNSTVNVYAMLQAYAKCYKVEGLNEQDLKFLKEEKELLVEYRKKYAYLMIGAFFFIVISLMVSFSISNELYNISRKIICKLC